MSTEAKVEELVEFLEDEFGGLKIDASHDAAGSMSNFQIEADVDSHMILSIQDDCFEANGLEDIKSVLAGPARVVMESNLNKPVQLNSDLSVTV